MVAQARDGRGIQTLQFLGSALGLQRAHISVDDVASDENKVGLFGIDHIHPAAHFGAGIVETRMQVTDHNDFQGTVQMLTGRQVDFLALLVMVMDVAADKGHQHHACHDQRRDAIGLEPCGGYQVDKPPDVKHKERHEQIKHDDQP